MKKIFVFLFLFSLFLTSCNTNKTTSSSSSSNISSTPFYTNEEIRYKLKDRLYQYQQQIQDKNTINIKGELEIPDFDFEGMHVFKNIDIVFENVVNDPYMRIKSDVFNKEDGSLTLVKNLDMIRVTQNLILKDVVDYSLEEIDENKNKYYSKTVDERGGVIFNSLVTALVSAIKDQYIEDLPSSIEYSYNRDSVTYGLKFNFEDLKGTEVSEYINLALGFFPQLNELIMQFKDQIIVQVSDLKIDMPTSSFHVEISYPTMNGAFLFPIIQGNFNINYKSIVREDVTKLNVNKTYLKAKKGNNNVSSYLYQKDNEYETGIVLDKLIGIDFTNKDIISQLKQKDFKIKADNAKKIRYFDRFSNEELFFKDDIVKIELMDSILVLLTYENNGIYYVSVEPYLEENI